MEKDKLPPIPTPVSQRWREFRIQVLPFLVFVAILTGVVYLWKTYVQPIGVIGAAETNLVNVTSLQDGIISELFVERFQNVTTGQVIAIVVNTDPEVIKAQIASVQGEIKVLRERGKIDIQRTEQAYREFRQDLFTLNTEQRVQQVQLILASLELDRAEIQVKQNLIPPAELDAAKSKRDSIAAAIEERQKQLVDLTAALSELNQRNTKTEPDPYEEAIDAKAKELELMLKPSILRAPINGMVSIVHHLPGERILRGMPVVSVSDPDTKRIVGYVRQPVSRVPTTNDSVRIMTRTHPRRSAIGRILRVGAQFEMINPALIAADSKRMEVGLPILVEVPPGIRILPGEYVDLVVNYSAGEVGVPIETVPLADTP